MTSLPSGSQPATHRARDIAEGFGADAGRYDRARPTYPRELVGAIVAASPGRRFLDVGIGTGIAARLFRGAGCRVLGVDVDPRMAELARNDGFEVEVGKFEEWDSAERVFDAIIAGQTWHWVDPVAGAQKAAEVLRPVGRLALFWNVFQPASEVAEAFAAAYDRVDTGFPFNFWKVPPLVSYEPGFTTAADGIRKSAAFAEPEQWRFGWEREYTRDEWLDQVLTQGGHSRIAPEKLEALLTELGDAVDDWGGSFTMGYIAVVVTAARASDVAPTATKARISTASMGLWRPYEEPPPGGPVPKRVKDLSAARL
ncbi:MAG: class I SAM-dependent methyltransferase [Mycobacteriales bacterium]